MRRIILLLFIVCMGIAGGGPTVLAQTNITVPLTDRVYHLLDIAYIRGTISRVSVVKPYTLETVSGYIDDIRSGTRDFSGYERQIVDSVTRRYTVEPKHVNFDLSLDAVLRTDLKAASDYHLNSAYNFNFYGDISPVFSYKFHVAPTLDKVNTDAFAPFSFTKTWEGTHVGTETGHTGGDTEKPTFAQAYYPELTFSLLNDRLLLRWAKIRRNWGIGESSLQLSGQAYPFGGIGGHMMLAPWLKTSFVTGSLGDYFNKDSSQTMLSTRRAEFFLFDWLYLSFYDSCIWGKRFELYYMNPFSISFLSQSIIGDLDNVFIGGTISVRIAPYVLGYFSLMIDDYRIEDISPFTHPLWKFAFYGGVKVPVPYLPLTLFTFQYTKIEPWMYTHYHQSYPFFTKKINTSYVHTGENLGYYLQPNSDEFLFKLKSMPLEYLTALLQYQYIRHGDGDYSEGQVEGDINKPQRLTEVPLSAYPDKDFLNDGIYEYIHIIKLRADFDFDIDFLQLSVGPEYTFVHGRNFNNIEGNNIVKHLVALNLSGSINVFSYSRKQ